MSATLEVMRRPSPARRQFAVVPVLLGVVSFSNPAMGQPSEARRVAQHARGLALGGQCEEAIPELDRAIALNPQQLDLLRARGECFARLGRREEAVRDLEAYAAAANEADVAPVRQRIQEIQVLTRVPARGASPASAPAPPTETARAAPCVIVAPSLTPKPGDILDSSRFRGGIELDVGVFKPPSGALGAVGVSGQLGLQVGDLVGVYVTPGLTYLNGSAAGVDVTSALVVDFTVLKDRLTIGAGPEAGVFAYLGTSSVGGGVGYGARLHVAWNAVVSREDGRARRALALGLDARFVIGPEATASAANVLTSGGPTSHVGFTFAPVLSVEYVSF